MGEFDVTVNISEFRFRFGGKSELPSLVTGDDLTRFSKMEKDHVQPTNSLPNPIQPAAHAPPANARSVTGTARVTRDALWPQPVAASMYPDEDGVSDNFHDSD
jgi:hypothetical protein